MSDDRSRPEVQRCSHIDAEQDGELRYWTHQLNVSKKELKRAVRLVGGSIDKVREHLRTSCTRRSLH